MKQSNKYVERIETNTHWLWACELNSYVAAYNDIHIAMKKSAQNKFTKMFGCTFSQFLVFISIFLIFWFSIQTKLLPPIKLYLQINWTRINCHYISYELITCILYTGNKQFGKKIFRINWIPVHSNIGCLIQTDSIFQHSKKNPSISIWEAAKFDKISYGR